MQDKNEIILALKELNESFKNLNNLLNEGNKLNNLKSLKNCPFGKPYNESSVDIKLWIASMIGDIELNSH